MVIARFFVRAALGVLIYAGIAVNANADLYMTDYFSGQIHHFNETTKVKSTFANIGEGAGLSGIAINHNTNTLYASSLSHGGIYSYNLLTASQVGFHSLGGYGPGGISVSSTGNIFVTDFSSGNLRIYDSTFSTPLSTISVPEVRTSGVGVLANGDLLISTLGDGVFRYDGISLTQFSSNPLASAQIAQDSNGNVFVGHGVGFSNSVFKFDALGNPLATIDISPAMIDSFGGSAIGTSPSGIVIDKDGNLIVAVLGQANPMDEQEIRGGVLKFTPEGVLLDTYIKDSFAYSAIAYSAVPEPGTMLLVAVTSIAAIGYKRRGAICNKQMVAPEVS